MMRLNDTEYTKVQYSTVQYTVHSTVQYSTVQYSTVSARTDLVRLCCPGGTAADGVALHPVQRLADSDHVVRQHLATVRMMMIMISHI